MISEEKIYEAFVKQGNKLVPVNNPSLSGQHPLAVPGMPGFTANDYSDAEKEKVANSVQTDGMGKILSQYLPEGIGKIVVGSYSGIGGGNSALVTISGLPSTPKLMFIFPRGYFQNMKWAMLGGGNGLSLVSGSAQGNQLTITETETSITWYGDTYLNTTGQIYDYIIIC